MAIAYNRAERRAIAHGRAFSEHRYAYQPAHNYVGIDGDLMEAWREYADHTDVGYPTEDAWFDGQTIPDHPQDY